MTLLKTLPRTPNLSGTAQLTTSSSTVQIYSMHACMCVCMLSDTLTIPLGSIAMKLKNHSSSIVLSALVNRYLTIIPQLQQIRFVYYVCMDVNSNAEAYFFIHVLWLVKSLS